MAASQSSSSSLKRNWRGGQAGPASRAARWIARLVLTLAAVGLAAVFLYFVSRSRQPTRTYLFEQVAEYDQTRDDVPPGSYFFDAADQRYFEQPASGVVFADQKFGDLIVPAVADRPVVVCLAGQALAAPGAGCEMLDPVSGSPRDLGRLFQEVAALRSPLKLVVLELGSLAADPSRGVALNQAAMQIEGLVRQTNDPGLWVLVSHGTGQVSWLPPLRHRSPYCESVALGLRGRADQPSQGGNNNGRVDLAELAVYVAARTFAWSRAHAPAVQTPVLLRGGQGAVDAARLMDDAPLRAMTLAHVLPEAAAPEAAPKTTAPPAAKTARGPVFGRTLAWGQAGAAPTTAPGTSRAPAEAARSIAPEDGAVSPPAEAPPAKPPETIDEFFRELWKLRDQLEAAPELGESPLDYGPLAWQLFQTSLADRQLRYRMDRLESAILLPELQRFYAELARFAPQPGGGAAPRGAGGGGNRVAEALSLLAAARSEQAGAWSAYRAQSAADGGFADALRRLQRALVRLPGLRAVAAATMTDDSQLCRRVARLEATSAEAVGLLNADSLDPAGAAGFVRTVEGLDDEQLVAELVAQALSGRLMAVETLLATPLPAAEQRAELLARAAKLSDSKLHDELPRSRPPEGVLDPNARQWALFEPWCEVVEGSDRLLALTTGTAESTRESPTLGWERWRKLGADLAASQRRLEASYRSGSPGGNRLRYWQAFLMAPREFRAARAFVEHGVPPWPRFDAGPIALAIGGPEVILLPPRFGTTAKATEFTISIRCQGAPPRSLSVALTYPAESMELTWQGPRGDAERQAVSNAESYPLTPSGSLDLKFWARARRDRLADDLRLEVTARAARDGQTPSEARAIPMRLGPPEVEIVAPQTLACFPGQTTIPLAIVNQTSRPLSQLTVKLLARDPATPAAAEPLAEATIAELPTGNEPIAIPFVAAPPPMGTAAAAGQPVALDLTDREVVCEVWEPAPAPPAGEEAPPPAAPTLLLSRVLGFNALRPWDYLQPVFTWGGGRQQLQVRFVPHSERLPAAGSNVRWNADHSTLSPEPGQRDAVVRFDDRGLLAAQTPRDLVVEPESWRVVLDVDGYARGLVYDVPADPQLGARSLSRSEVRLIPRLLPPPDATPEQEKAFEVERGWAIDPKARRIVMRPDDRVQVTAEVNVPPLSTFAAQQRDAIALGFDENGNGRLDSLEIQASFRAARDTRLFWEGVEPQSGALRVAARSADWSTGLTRLPAEPSRPVVLIGEVRRQGAEEPVQDAWQVVIDHQPPRVRDVQRLTLRQGAQSTLSVTVDDPPPASGVDRVEVALWRAGISEPKWIEALPDEGNPARWTAPLDTKDLQPQDYTYDVMVRVTDRVGNAADRPHQEPGAVRILPPLPPEEMQKSKANKVLVTMSIRGQAPRSGEVSLLKDGKPFVKQPLDAKGQCVFEDVDAGTYEVQATGRTRSGQPYELAAPLSVTVKELPAPPARVTGNLDKYVM